MSSLDQQSDLDQLVDRRIDVRRSIDYSHNDRERNGITLTASDIVKVVSVLLALGGAWMTLNKQITDISIKQSIAEMQYTEIKQSLTRLDAKLAANETDSMKDKVQLQNQVRDLENSMTQIYQKVTSRK
jgi:hypothetical protein